MSSSKYLFEPPERTERATVPRIPSTCDVTGCNRDTVVAMASGEKHGRQFVSNGSTFLSSRYGDNGTVYAERNGCRFDHWITRCAVCYERDMERAGKCQGQQA